MQVEISHHIDASDPDEDGNYLYYYEYDIYVFSEGDTFFSARAYTDEPDCASFQGKTQAGKDSYLTKDDLDHPLLLAAYNYLKKSGKTELLWFGEEFSEYLPVPNLTKDMKGCQSD
ncbi:hypothetical protein [Phyllobacterium sp. SB3]|uniref:hypothetical protein n=1 Tax=Phyllobacterium sp. SB3 TaxID=3156073 RepID=UPI0032AF6BEB